jgi:hypothetical protein
MAFGKGGASPARAGGSDSLRNAGALCYKLVSLTTPIRLGAMRTFGWRLGWWLVLFASAAWLGAGCAKDSGSKEFIPGKGWKSTQVERKAAEL